MLELTKPMLLVLIAFIALNWTDTAENDAHESRTPLGVWDLQGVSDDDTRWIATLLLHVDDSDRLTGHVDWIGENGASGREFVSGGYDRKERTLRFEGTRVAFADRVVRCAYEARLSPDGWTLEDGRWSHLDPTVPGAWSARRLPLE